MHLANGFIIYELGNKMQLIDLLQVISGNVIIVVNKKDGTIPVEKIELPSDSSYLVKRRACQPYCFYDVINIYTMCDQNITIVQVKQFYRE